MIKLKEAPGDNCPKYDVKACGKAATYQEMTKLRSEAQAVTSQSENNFSEVRETIEDDSSGGDDAPNFPLKPKKNKCKYLKKFIGYV